MTIEEKFLSYVERKNKNGCWIWGGPLQKGYGRLYTFKKLEMAHIVSYKIYVGNIPRGLKCLHSCDNPKCVNPKHLFLGTQYDNVQDCIRKGRAKKFSGYKNGLDFRGVQRALKKLNSPLREIAGMYKTSITTVWRIKNKISKVNIKPHEKTK